MKRKERRESVVGYLDVIIWKAIGVESLRGIQEVWR